MGLQRGKNEIDGRNSRKNRDKSGLERVRRCSIALIDRIQTRYPNTRFPNIQSRIPRIANCTVYETVVSRSLIFRVNRLLLFRNCFTLFYIQLCNFTVGSLLRRSALFLRSLFSEWNFSHTSSVCSLCVHLSFELLKLFLECSYIYSFSSLFLTVLKS